MLVVHMCHGGADIPASTAALFHMLKFCADSTKPIKLVLISKPAPVQAQYSFMSIPVLANICMQLHRHEEAVCPTTACYYFNRLVLALLLTVCLLLCVDAWFCQLVRPHQPEC